MAENNSNDLMRLAILAGLGVGGYFLWKYLKEGPEDVKKGFNISQIRWEPAIPIINEEITITVLGKNNTEEGDCYCKIINLDNQQEVFYDHAIVGKGELKNFDYITTMLPELKLRFETGKIIEGEQELHSFQEITIKGKKGMEISNVHFDVKV